MNSTVEICRLCLERICGNGFDAMDDIAEKMLETLLLTLDLNLIEKPVMCKKCAVNLDKFVNFKSICLNTNSLRKIKSEKDNDVHDDHICQFCVRDTKIECCTYLNETKNIVSIVDVIEKHIPELKFNLTQEVITCTSCLEALQSMPTFIMKCLDVEGKIKKYAESLDDVSGQISLYDIQQLYSKPIIKCEDRCGEQNSYKSLYSKGGDIDVKTEIKNEEFEEVGNLDFTIKNEEIDIKQESSESESLQDCVSSEEMNNYTLPKMQECLLTKSDRTLPEIFVKSDEKNNNRPLKHTSTQENTSIGKEHQSIHKDSSEIYHCEHCSFQTKRKWTLKRHLLTHENTSEKTAYQCEHCLYQTNCKYKLNRHFLCHKSSREVTMHKCEHCSFQTKYKNKLKLHFRVHKSPYEINMYQCKHCHFLTKYESGLQRHSLTHKDLSELTMYLCEHCSYQTKYKDKLKRHLVVHQNPSEITIYQCEHCSFRTKQRQSLKVHLLRHKNPSEIPMYQCEHCSFLTKQKTYLKRHMLMHKNLSEIIMYQCKHCSFQTKRKGYLKVHSLKHQNPSEITMYQCAHCSYETRYKSMLKKHFPIHKNP